MTTMNMPRQTRLGKRFEIFKVLCKDILWQWGPKLQMMDAPRYDELEYAAYNAPSLREVEEMWVKGGNRHHFDKVMKLADHIAKTNCLETMGDAQFATFLELCRFIQKWGDPNKYLRLALEQVVQCRTFEEVTDVVKSFKDEVLTDKFHSVDLSALTLAKHLSSDSEKFFLKIFHKRFGQNGLGSG